MTDSFLSPSLQRGMILKEQGRFGEALHYFQEDLAQRPDNAITLGLIASCQVNIPAERERATSTIEQAIGKDAEEPFLHRIKSAILLDLKRPKEALAAADEAIRLDPAEANGFIMRGFALAGLERWPDAETAARAALERNADDVDAENLLAHAQRLQNKMPETRASIDSLLAKDPENSMSHANAGWSALQGGDHEKARTHFLEALRLDPDCEFARQGMIEAFKARSPTYRQYLKYCLFMQRLSRGQRYALIIGLVLAVRFSRRLFTGDWQLLGIGIGMIYFLFVLWVWVAGGVGNLLIMADRFARHALTRAERIEGVVVGGGVVVGVLAIVTAILVSALTPLYVPLLILGGALIVAAFPLALTFTNEHRVGRFVYGALGLQVLAAGGCLLVDSLLPGVLAPGFLNGIFTSGLVGAVVATWLGTFNVLRA